MSSSEGGSPPRDTERAASPPPADEPAEEYKIFVGNLSWSTDTACACGAAAQPARACKPRARGC